MSRTGRPMSMSFSFAKEAAWVGVERLLYCVVCIFCLALEQDAVLLSCFLD